MSSTKSTKAPETIDAYIASFPAPVQTLLRELRATIRSAAPEASERISYGIPAFELQGPVVYFAAFKHHIGFYPVPRGHPDFKRDLAPYKGGKGTAQFPLDQPLPTDLIQSIVEFRLQSNRDAANAKRRKGKP